MDFMEKIFMMAEKVDEIKELVKELEVDELQTVICMTLEEYCKANGENIVDCSNKIHEAITLVNSELGAY